MTNEQLNNFKKNIYEPYAEAWQIMKIMRDSEPKDDKFWKDYISRCDSFSEKYKNEIGSSMYRVLLDAGDECGRIIRQN